MDLRILTIPPHTTHSHTVVFLDGCNSRGVLFIDMFQRALTSRLQSLPDAFPSLRWVFPQSEILPVALPPPERWTQPFDPWNVHDFGDQQGLQSDWLRQSVAGIRRIARREAELLGGRWDKVILAGMGHGGSTMVHALLNLDLVDLVPGATSPLPAGNERLGALIVFSSWMPCPGRTVAEIRKSLSLEEVPDRDKVVRNTPVLLEHCIDDPVAPVDWGRNLRDQLISFGCRITWREYSEGGHWFNSPTGMDDVVAFLSQALGSEFVVGSSCDPID